MNQQDLESAIRRSGGKQNALNEMEALWQRLDLLHQTGRYGRLLNQLLKSNDKDNFLALVLEANFAHQFESQNLPLTYEVKQGVQHKSSIDFLRNAPGGDSVYFELRLLQEAQSILESINRQLKRWKVYRIMMDGQDEQDEIVRLQNTVIGKVQDKNGKPTKFFSTAANAVNLVVVDASASILGMVDVLDCKLAAYGDRAVEHHARRQVFGLFQEALPEDPEHIQALATKYAHIRQTLHGVLFLFKVPHTGLIAYQLEQLLMWNPAMLTEARARSVYADLSTAIPLRSDRVHHPL